MDFKIIIVSIIVMILIGFFAKKVNLLSSDDVETLNNIVVNIALPCMIFQALYVARTSLFASLSILTLYMLICSLIVGIITYLILKIAGWDSRKIWTIVVCVVLGNTGFLGYPVTSGIFGAEGMIRAVFCDISTSILFISLSIILIILFEGDIRQALRKILIFPPLWAIILGLLFNIFSIPITAVGETVVDYLAGATVPLIMISLGLSLNIEGLKNHLLEVSFASLMKLIVFPLVGLAVLALLGITGLNHTIGLIEAAMSSAMLCLVLAINHKLDIDLTSDCLFTSTLFALVTIPVFLLFVV